VRLIYDLPVGPVGIDAVPLLDYTDRLAANNLRIIADSYEAEFEDESRYGRHALQPGSVRAHFSPDSPTAVIANRRRMIEDTSKNGSRYWRAEIKGQQVGLGKISPSYVNGRTGKLYGERPNAYVNDVLVSPRWQGKRIGSALLHGMLKFSTEFRADAVVVFDVAADSPLNEKAVALGFRPVRTNGLKPLAIGSSVLAQFRYETDEDHNLSTLIGTLEDAEPALADPLWA
jgi:GNAT superfamily N-acetyltransferase